MCKQRRHRVAPSDQGKEVKAPSAGAMTGVRRDAVGKKTNLFHFTLRACSRSPWIAFTHPFPGLFALLSCCQSGQVLKWSGFKRRSALCAYFPELPPHLRRQDEAKKTLLRTHTTAVSAGALEGLGWSQRSFGSPGRQRLFEKMCRSSRPAWSGKPICYFRYLARTLM